MFSSSEKNVNEHELNVNSFEKSGYEHKRTYALFFSFLRS